jgi:hypothetical protein
VEVVVLGAICGVAIGALVWSVDRAHKIASESLKAQQVAHLEAAERVRSVIVEAMDRIQARTLVEAVEVANLRAQSDVNSQMLRDELNKIDKKNNGKKSESRMMHTIDGRMFDESELEAL